MREGKKTEKSLGALPKKIPGVGCLPNWRREVGGERREERKNEGKKWREGGPVKGSLGEEREEWEGKKFEGEMKSGWW